MTILQRREAGLRAAALGNGLSEVPGRMSGEQGPLLGSQVPVWLLDFPRDGWCGKWGPCCCAQSEWLCEYHQACSGHCLLEDMLVRVLMLLVSVTTIADGNREVWEYWGGSCLCAYMWEFCS